MGRFDLPDVTSSPVSVSVTGSEVGGHCYGEKSQHQARPCTAQPIGGRGRTGPTPGVRTGGRHQAEFFLGLGLGARPFLGLGLGARPSGLAPVSPGVGAPLWGSVAPAGSVTPGPLQRPSFPGTCGSLTPTCGRLTPPAATCGHLLPPDAQQWLSPTFCCHARITGQWRAPTPSGGPVAVDPVSLRCGARPGDPWTGDPTPI
jgi:hypothetical protein